MPVKWNVGALRITHIGDVTSQCINGRVVRKECAIVDGLRFYRFTIDSGMVGEFSTFWSDNEDLLRGATLKRVMCS